MPDLRFAVESAEAAPSAATPRLVLRLAVANAPADEAIHSVLLRCQVSIDPARRRYSAAEEALLRDLFGARERWGETLRALPWTDATVLVPAFEGSTVVGVPVVCSIDVTQGPAKFLFALEAGEVPVTLLLSGSIFHRGPGGAVQVASVPWDRQATFRVPVELVKRIAEQHHSGAAFVSLRRDVFDRLLAYRLERGHPSWEHAVESLLARAGAARTEAKEAA